MSSIHSILVPTDFSACARASLQHAVHLARKCGCDLHLVHVVENPDGGDEPGMQENRRLLVVRNIADRYAADLASVDGLQAGRVFHEVLFAPDAAQAVLEYAQQHAVDLIVMGAHGDTAANRFLICGLDHLLVGTTADAIVRQAPCPVLTVGLRNGRSPAMVHRVLVSVTGNPSDHPVLSYAREVASVYKARLDVLLCVEPEASNFQERCRDTREYLGAANGSDVELTFHCRPGYHMNEVSHFAEEQGIQLIVLGARGVSENEWRPEDNAAEGASPMAAFSVLTMKRGSEVSEGGLFMGPQSGAGADRLVAHA